MPEEPTTVDLSDHAADWETVLQARARAAEWKTLADTIMGKIKEAMGDADRATLDGKPFLERRPRQVTRVDSAKLRSTFPEELLEPYLKTTTEYRYEPVEAWSE